MKLIPPDDQYEWVPIVLFPNQGFGHGFGTTRLGVNAANGGVTSLPEGYHHTCNMTVAGGRTLSPSFAATINQGLAASAPPSSVTPWEDTSGVPTVIITLDNRVKLMKNGGVTDETQASGNTANLGSAAFWDDGAGTPYIVTGTSSGSFFIQKRTQSGTWSTTADTDRKAKYVAEAGGALYGNPNSYQVHKWAAGNDPTSNDPGTTIRVGTPAADINSIGAIGGSPVVGKEDGIWTFNADGDFQNDYPMNPHPDNFPFMKSDGQGGLLTATWDGSLVRLQKFGNIISAHPLRDKSPDRNSPRGRIVDAVVYQDHIYVLHGAKAGLTQPSGLVMYLTTDNGTTFEEMTGDVTDGRLDTTAVISNLGTFAGGFWIYIGADTQFNAVQFTMSGLNTNAVRMKAGWLAGGTTISRFGTALHDGTDTDPAGTMIAFGQTGAVAWGAGNDLQNWDAASVTINGTAVSKYWVRFFLE